LGLSEEDAGQLNLREFDELIERKKADDDRLRLNAGFIYAAVMNTAAWGDPNRIATQPTDIVPSMKKEFDLRDLSPEQQLSYFMGCFYGKDKKTFNR
jgi:hypothetical protein